MAHACLPSFRDAPLPEQDSWFQSPSPTEVNRGLGGCSIGRRAVGRGSNVGIGRPRRQPAIKIVATGAGGGGGSSAAPPDGGAGGAGAIVETAYAVTPGASLDVKVGTGGTAGGTGGPGVGGAGLASGGGGSRGQEGQGWSGDAMGGGGGGSTAVTGAGYDNGSGGLVVIAGGGR